MKQSVVVENNCICTKSPNIAARKIGKKAKKFKIEHE